MEHEASPTPRLLVDVLKTEYPAASQVRISFPDKWEFVDQVGQNRQLLYIGGFPLERAFNGREHFEGLPPEINVNLVFYRLYKFFQPWPQPQVLLRWDQTKGEGTVVGERGYRLQLQPVGQAQAWFGVSHAVLWECYLEPSRQNGNWQDTLRQVWAAVEQDVEAPKLFTTPDEPTFPEGYSEFLRGVGYSPDVEHRLWWSKERGTGARTRIAP